MKTVFITGASGLIGRELTGILLQKGFNIIGTDKTPSPFNGQPNFKFIQADIIDKGKVSPILEGSRVDALVHLACSVDNDYPSSIGDREEDDSKTVDKYLYKSALTGNVRDIILLSTTQVYAQQKTREPVREMYDEKPATNYAKIKFDSEKALMSLTKKGEAKATIMRIAPIYTKAYVQNLHDRIYDYKDNIAYLFRDGEYGFSFCCLYNVVDFILGILMQDGSYQYQGIYNVCDTKIITAREIAAFERDFHNLTNVVQRNYTPDIVKAAIAFAGKRVKTDYRYVDMSTITNNYSYDNTKAQRIAPFRWKLSNTR